jgi:hypothetical protein
VRLSRYTLLAVTKNDLRSMRNEEHRYWVGPRPLEVAGAPMLDLLSLVCSHAHTAGDIGNENIGQKAHAEMHARKLTLKILKLPELMNVYDLYRRPFHA